MLITGDLIKYLGCSDNQVLDGFTNDPRGFLKIGDVYEVDIAEQHGNRERIWLTGLEGAFDSTCFALQSSAVQVQENVTVVENVVYVDDCYYPSVADIIVADIIEDAIFGGPEIW